MTFLPEKQSVEPNCRPDPPHRGWIPVVPHVLFRQWEESQRLPRGGMLRRVVSCQRRRDNYRTVVSGVTVCLEAIRGGRGGLCCAACAPIWTEGHSREAGIPFQGRLASRLFPFEPAFNASSVRSCRNDLHIGEVAQASPRTRHHRHEVHRPPEKEDEAEFGA